MRTTFTLALALAGSLQTVRAGEKAKLPTPSSLSAMPDAFTIRGADDVQRVLISGEVSKGEATTIDYSRHAAFVSSDPKVAVIRDGIVIPTGNGIAQITATFAPNKPCSRPG